MSAGSVMVIDKYGNKVWKNAAGELHREDGPAIEYSDGSKQWYKNGQHHREDGPACEYCNGREDWWVNGARHREGAPAVDNWKDKYWFQNGERHNPNGPAILWADGRKEWYLYGEKISDDPSSVVQYLSRSNFKEILQLVVLIKKSKIKEGK